MDEQDMCDAAIDAANTQDAIRQSIASLSDEPFEIRGRLESVVEFFERIDAEMVKLGHGIDGRPRQLLQQVQAEMIDRLLADATERITDGLARSGDLADPLPTLSA